MIMIELCQISYAIVCVQFNVALWDTLAENFDASTMPVVAIKGARITEFGGSKSASLGQSSQLQINPDIPKAHQLRGWYDSLDTNHEFSNISNRIGGDSGDCTVLFITFMILRLPNAYYEE